MHLRFGQHCNLGYGETRGGGDTPERRENNQSKLNWWTARRATQTDIISFFLT